MSTFLALAGVVPFLAAALDAGPVVVPERLPAHWTQDDLLLTHQQCKLLTWAVLYSYLTSASSSKAVRSKGSHSPVLAIAAVLADRLPRPASM
jgi:hypothetical protein